MVCQHLKSLTSQIPNGRTGVHLVSVGPFLVQDVNHHGRRNRDDDCRSSSQPITPTV